MDIMNSQSRSQQDSGEDMPSNTNPEFWSLGSQENWISSEANKIMLGHISSALVDLSTKVFVVVVAAAVVIPML